MQFKYNVEDYLDILLSRFTVDITDRKLLFSLQKQISKGVGLTDRQYELLKEKLLSYKNFFIDNGYEYFDLSNTRLEIRSIDRSRWIRLIEVSGNRRIGVRFTFNKKLISCLEDIKKQKCEGIYDKENKIHHFEYNEINLFKLINIFKNREFEIEETLFERYRLLEDMNNNKESYIPGIYNFKLKNLNQRAIDYMISTIGEPCLDNLALYCDRKETVGLKYFDQSDLDTSIFNLTTLSQKIVKRQKQHVFANSEIYTLDQVIESILELHRLPLLVLLPDHRALDHLSECHQRFRNIVLNESVAVLFRKDNDVDGIHFNKYVKDNGLNNPLDKSTKIVYILDNKLPKPLVSSDWKASCVLSMSSTRFTSRTDVYINENDLIIYFDKEISYFARNNTEVL